jgi:beta-glucosidase-like glycosyl hydrolase
MEIEFYPYKKMFHEGLSSVMVAHLNVPSLEPRSEYPSSISYNVVTDVSKELGFKGLIFTDALNMKSINNKLLAKSVLKPLWQEMMCCYFQKMFQQQ